MKKYTMLMLIWVCVECICRRPVVSIVEAVEDINVKSVKLLLVGRDASVLDDSGRYGLNHTPLLWAVKWCRGVTMVKILLDGRHPLIYRIMWEIRHFLVPQKTSVILRQNY